MGIVKDDLKAVLVSRLEKAASLDLSHDQAEAVADYLIETQTVSYESLFLINKKDSENEPHRKDNR